MGICFSKNITDEHMYGTLANETNVVTPYESVFNTNYSLPPDFVQHLNVTQPYSTFCDARNNTYHYDFLPIPEEE